MTPSVWSQEAIAWETFAPEDRPVPTFAHSETGAIEFELPQGGGSGVYLKPLNIGEIITYKLIPDLALPQGLFVTSAQELGAPQATLTTSPENTLQLEVRSEAGGDVQRWDLRDLTEGDLYLHLVSHRFTTYLYTSTDGAVWNPEIAVDLPTEQAAFGGLLIRGDAATSTSSEWLGTHSIFFADVALEKTEDEAEGSATFGAPWELFAGTYEVYVQGEAGELREDISVSILSASGETLPLNQVATAGDSLWEFVGHADLAEGYQIQLAGEGSENASVRLLGSGWDDEDGDGMPDVWEEANGLDPTTADAWEDIDGDGYPNILELFQGSDPTSSSADTESGGTTLYVDPENGSDHFDGWRRLRVAGRSLGPKKSYNGASKTLGEGGGTIHIKGGNFIHEIDVIGPNITIIPDGDVIIRSTTAD